MIRSRSLLAAATTISLSGIAGATTLFYDDFEDEYPSLTTIPVITTTSVVAGDSPDVGLGWGRTLSANGVVFPDGSNHVLNLGNSTTNGDKSRYIEAQFASAALADGAVTIDFDLLWDHTPAGSTFAIVTVLSGADEVLELDFRRGPDKRVSHNGTDLFDVDNSDTEWHSVSITLHETSFDVTLVGSGAGTVTGLSYTTTPTSVDAVQFSNTAQPSARVAYLDNVGVSQVPEPGSLALLGLSGLLVARRRRA